MTETSIIKQKFKSAIRRGTGEAYLIMRDYPKLDFSREIIQACLKNFAYDGQCEGSRAPYLFQFIELSGKQGKIRAVILKELASFQSDTWTLRQLFDLSKIFAQRGDEEARQAIYDRFLSNDLDDSGWVGSALILELDGMKGLLSVAEKFGKDLEADPEEWADENMVRFFQEENTDIDVWLQLEEAGKGNRFIRRYFEEIAKDREKRANYKAEKIVYNDIVDEALSRKGFRFILNRKLSDEELHVIAKRLITEKNKQKKQYLLTVFTRYKFPLDSKFILNVAGSSSPSAKQTTWLALRSLRFLKSDVIRQFAVENMEQAKNPVDFAWALAANYKDGDDQLLIKLAEKLKNEHDVERFIKVCLDIYEANETTKCKEPFEILYEKTNCSICRASIVKQLIDNGVLSAKIKTEIMFDCDSDTRQLAK